MVVNGVHRVIQAVNGDDNQTSNSVDNFALLVFASEVSLNTIWNNSEDDIYSELILCLDQKE